MASAVSAYMLIFRESTRERYQAMSADERRLALDEWNGWCDRLAADGILHSGHPLHDAGRTVAASGTTGGVDGPFAEAKELIGGFIIIEAGSLDEAATIAATSPLQRCGQTVEVREVAAACHLARSLGLATMRG